MEAIFVPSSAAAAADQSLSPSPYPYKQIKTPAKRNPHGPRSFISRSSENLPLLNSSCNVIHGGESLLFGPPPPPSSLSFSYPTPSLPAVYYRLHQQNHRQRRPLLPPPISMPQSSLPSRTHGLACPPTSRKNSRSRDHSLTPKKAKQFTKRVEPKLDPKLINNIVESSSVPLGPDPSDLPKDVSKVLSPPLSSMASNGMSSSRLGIKDWEKFSGSVYTPVYTPSPHPSSLPLPKFFVRRPNLISCTAEADVDAGATDSLRRLLHLR